MEVFDFAVLGGGSGGIATARRAAQHGARVALIESNALGGTCVNVGCVPKKVMWHAAQIAEAIHHAPGYGFDVQLRGHDWALLRQRRDAYVARLNDIYRANLEKDGVALIRGRGRFVASDVIGVAGRQLKAERFLVATGGRPMRPALPGAELGIDSDGFFELDRRPDRVVIVGAGYIAVELCGVLQALGAQVTLVVRGETVLRGFDAMLGSTLTDMLRADGVDVRTQSNVATIEAAGAQRRVTLIDGHQLEVDTLIWAVGRTPNTSDCGLDVAGVALDRAGHIVVDEWQVTSSPHVFAVGDVTGRVPLTPVAIAAGRRLADRLYGGAVDRRLDYDNVPSVVFSHPPIGSVGLDEATARARYGDSVRTYESRFRALFYGVLDEKRDSRMKLICAGDNERVVGVHAIGEGSDELLQGVAVALRLGATKRDFDDTVAIHPTSAEEMVTMR